MNESAFARIRPLSLFGFPLIVFAMELVGLPVRGDGPLYLNIARTNSTLVVTWTNPGAVLENAGILNGSWIEVTGAVSPRLIVPSNAMNFFRLRANALLTDFGFRYVAPTFTTTIGDPVGCGCIAPESPNNSGADGNAQDNALGNALLHTGELTQQATDLWIPGRGFDWRFTRRYRSGMNYDGPLGQGWDFNHNRRLMVENNGSVLCMDGLGRADRYTLNTNGTLDSPSGFYTRLTRKLDGTFEERDRHGTTNFYAATNALGIARLARIGDRNGNQMAFQYNSAGQLTNVVDTLTRSMAYRYDASGRLTNVLDFAGRSVRFSYDANGNLISATSPAVIGTPAGNDFPSGKTIRYAYASGFSDERFNHNLLSVTAPNEVAAVGPARLVAQYDTNPVSAHADRLVSLRLGGTNSGGIAAGGTIFYAYTTLAPAGSNDFASPVFQNTVTNRNGNVTEYRFNQLGNIARTVQFTRGVRAGDPPAFTNTFGYNQDGERFARTNAEGDAILYTFDAGNPDRLQQGNLLQVRHLPGSRGGDQAQITTSMTYETNFNFIATSTDGRGNVMTNRYDARGNRTNVVQRLPTIVESFEYNAFGQMTAHELPDNGNGHRRRDATIYYSSGPQNGYRQLQVVDSTVSSLTTIYEYDAVGNVIRTTDPRTNDTFYTYNSLNQLVSESSRPVAAGVRYTNLFWFDANDNLVRVDVQNRDAAGALQSNTSFTTIAEYDILDRRTRVVREKGSANLASNVVTYAGIPAPFVAQFLTEEYRYDANANPALTRFGQATAGMDTFNTLSLVYDERDLVYRTLRASGSPDQSTVQTDYGGNGNVQRTLQGTENASRTNSYSYDGFDRLVRTLDPMGNARTNHYDANGNRVSERDDGELADVIGSSGNARLAERTYSYDAMNRLTNRVDHFFDPQTQVAIGDGQSVTRFSYSANSQLLSITDDNTNRTSYAYDTVDRLFSVTDARSNSVSFSYDPNSNLLSKTNLDHAEVPGQTNETLRTTYSYDALDRLVRRVDNGGNTTSFAYDSRNNVTTITNGRDNRTIYSYDGLDRRIMTVSPLTDTGAGGGTLVGGITNRQTWDDSSCSRSQTDGNSNTTQYVYDSLDRLIRTQYADGTGSTNSYDVHDNRILGADANGTVVTTSYDLMNRVATNIVIPAPGVLGTTNETYSYDGLSRLVRAANDDSVVSNRFDSLSDLTRQSEQVLPGGATNIVAMTYDGVGNLTSIVYPSGRTIVRTFNALNRVKVSRDDPPGPGATNGVYQYIGPTRVARVDYGNDTRMDVTYDAVPRVRTIQHNSLGSPFYDHLFAWDQSHDLLFNTNRLFVGNYKQYQYDSVNRLIRSDDPLQSGTRIYDFDAVGNRTNGGGYIMDATLPEPADRQMNQYTSTPTSINVFDADGDLRQTGQNASIILNHDFRNRLVQVNLPFSYQATYKYDCFNRRIEKNVSGNVTRFVHAEGNEIEEQSSYGSSLATYVWCEGQLVQMNRNSQAYFYHCDQFGSPVSISDSTGSVVENCTYDDYGNPNPAFSSIGNPFLFKGYRYDNETGWYYCGDRYLDPVTGRFITRDPSGIWGDIGNFGNACTYAGNNPLSCLAAQDKPKPDDCPSPTPKPSSPTPKPSPSPPTPGKGSGKGIILLSPPPKWPKEPPLIPGGGFFLGKKSCTCVYYLLATEGPQVRIETFTVPAETKCDDYCKQKMPRRGVWGEGVGGFDGSDDKILQWLLAEMGSWY